jgi:hypothetical protein
MLSGPDLGGGYLHQLTIDRDGERTTFTYHAQDGGQDAGGPAKGPLDALGSAHPEVACQFGGPRCWHRRFLLGFADIPRVRLAYNRYRFVLETMLNQAYAGAPVGADSALEELVRRIAPVLAGEGVEWYIGGSMAARLLGAGVSPADIDLGTTRVGVDRIAGLIPEYLTEPVGPTDWPPAGIVHGARAFVGTFREGARVEWGTPIDRPDPSSSPEWSGLRGEARTLEAIFRGTKLRVTRPEYALVRAAEKGREESLAVLVELVRKVGPDLELLGGLVNRSHLDPGRRDGLIQRVAV